MILCCICIPSRPRQRHLIGENLLQYHFFIIFINFLPVHKPLSVTEFPIWDAICLFLSGLCLNRQLLANCIDIKSISNPEFTTNFYYRQYFGDIFFVCIWFTFYLQLTRLTECTWRLSLAFLSQAPFLILPKSLLPASLPDDTQCIFQNLLNYHVIGHQNGWNEKSKNIKGLQGIE